jgi:hypothetical protein
MRTCCGTRGIAGAVGWLLTCCARRRCFWRLAELDGWDSGGRHTWMAVMKQLWINSATVKSCRRIGEHRPFVTRSTLTAAQLLSIKRKKRAPPTACMHAPVLGENHTTPSHSFLHQCRHTAPIEPPMSSFVSRWPRAESLEHFIQPPLQARPV